MDPPFLPDRHPQRGLASLTRCVGAALRTRIWLPPRLYAAVPWIHLGAGSAALAGGLYLPDDTWYLPYLALAGLGLLHLAVAVAGMRRKRQARQRQASTA
jgi:hypothetical protein